jgi:hypothetical protein
MKRKGEIMNTSEKELQDHTKRCGGYMVNVINDWEGESEHWQGGRVHCVDICEECGFRDEYNLDGN